MATDRISRQTAAWALGAICVVGVGLRVYGLGFGLPDIHNPDEVPILNRALTIASTGPHLKNFLYPSLYLYASFAWQGGLFLLGRVLGWYHSVADFERAFFIDPSRHFVAARALTALFGALTIPAVYVFGQRLYGRAVGLGAALLLAVAPFAVRDAHYVKMDVPVALFVVLAHATLAAIVTDPARAARRRTWLVAGLWAGLAMSTQYYAIFVVVPIVAVAAADVRRSGRWQTSAHLLVWAGLGACLGFVATSPYFLIEIPTVIRDFRGLREADIDRAVVSGAFASLGSYLTMLSSDAAGWPVFATGIAGMALALVSDWRRGLLLVTFALPFLAFVSNTYPESRYVNVVIPIMCVAAAYAIARAVAVKSTQRFWIIAATVIWAGLVPLPGLAASIRWDRFLQQDDTRTQARHFIEREIPAGATVLLQPHGVPLRQSREGLLEALRANLGSPARASIKFQEQIALDPYPAPAYRTIFLGSGGHDADKIYVTTASLDAGFAHSPARAMGVQYVVLERYTVGGSPALRRLAVDLGRPGGHATRIAEFSPYRADAGPDVPATVAPFFHNTAARMNPALERPGPIIDIWRIDPWN